MNMTAQNSHELGFEIGQMEIIELDQKAKELMLPEWGKWKRKGNSLRHLDYPPCVLDFRARNRERSGLSSIVADISDEEGNRIELAVRSLVKPCRLLITAIYVAKASVNQLAKQNRTSRPSIDQMHAVALGMLSEKLRA